MKYQNGFGELFLNIIIDFFLILHIIKCKESKENQTLILERVLIMEIAKISSKGQITIPASVRKKLNLKTGDKIVIFEENGRFYFENSAMLAFKRVEEAFAGEAFNAGFETEDDMQDYMREIRKEVFFPIQSNKGIGKTADR